MNEDRLKMIEEIDFLIPRLENLLNLAFEEEELWYFPSCCIRDLQKFRVLLDARIKGISLRTICKDIPKSN